MLPAEGLTLAENVCTREEWRRVSKISLRIDVPVIAHDPCNVVFLTGIVEGLIGVDGHVGGPIVIAPIHPDYNQAGEDSGDVLLDRREEWCGQETCGSECKL